MRTSTSTSDLLAAVRARPGRTAAQLAGEMTVGRGRVYKILAELWRTGQVTKDAHRRWFPAAAARNARTSEFMTIRVPVAALFSDDPKLKSAFHALATPEL